MKSAKKQKLIIFTRYPVAGKTKTRLIPSLGAQAAADLQSWMTGQTVLKSRCFAATDKTAIEVRYQGRTHRPMRRWLGRDLAYVRQGDGNLGQKMRDAFQQAFDDGFDRVVIIGSDCPTLDETILANAFEALNDSHVAIGPATDGGYYLIGLNRPMPELFSDVDWGTDAVYAQTLAHVKMLGLQPVQLPMLSDIDRPDDLSQLDHCSWQNASAQTISVIIVALNEQAHIEASVLSARQGAVEVLTADGGSTDNTARHARQAGATVVHIPYGRAAQLNIAARKAVGDVLLFVHADTRLPAGFADAITAALGDPSVVGGAFSLGIDAYTNKCLSLGLDNDEMMEAVHVAAAMAAGDTLAHATQMRKIIKKKEM